MEMLAESSRSDVMPCCSCCAALARCIIYRCMGCMLSSMCVFVGLYKEL